MGFAGAKVQGSAELVSRLKSLAPAAQRKVLRPVMAEQGRKIAKLAKTNAPKKSGLLAKSMGSKVRAQAFVFPSVASRDSRYSAERNSADWGRHC